MLERIAARPPVSLIVPFAGTRPAAQVLVERLGAVRLGPADEIIVADNSLHPAFGAETADWLRVRRADDHSSSYYARNLGAEAARGDWLLFMDADCEPRADLIERHVEAIGAERCGAIAGAVLDAPDQPGLAARWTRERGFFNQAHLTSLGPWSFALTANLLVRRSAFDEIGGFCEGIRSAGDKEFAWRLTRAGWTLEYNERAAVVHHHREALSRLARQLARYDAGNAWFDRRHGESGFLEQTDVDADARTMAKGVRNIARSALQLDRDGVAFRLIDAFALVQRRVAWRLPNVAAPAPPAQASVVVVSDRFPTGDAQIEAVRRAHSNGGVHVEARGRPVDRLRPGATRPFDVAYGEDDAPLTRWSAALDLIARHPLRTGRWLRARKDSEGARALLRLAPAAQRVALAGATALEPLDEEGARLAAELAPLTGLAVRPHASTG